MRVGTDCSGIDCPILSLSVPFEHVFSCEVDKHARDVILKHHAPSILYDDVTKREHCKVPDVDLYVAGFPCQAFSYLGKRKARDDPRGRIFDHIFEYLSAKRPPNILLENVARLKTMHGGSIFRDICDRLQSIGYYLHHSILNTKDFGLPQSRHRLYIVGFRTQRAFSFPKTVPLEFTLSNLFHMEERPPVNITDWEESNVQKIMKGMKERGWDLNKPHLIDAQCTAKFIRLPPEDDISPCITTRSLRYLWCKEGSPYYRLSAKDAFALQGIHLDINKSRTQCIKMAGNGMSVNVIRKIINQIFNLKP